MSSHALFILTAVTETEASHQLFLQCLSQVQAIRCKPSQPQCHLVSTVVHTMHLNMKKWHISLCWTFASALVSWKQRDCINSDQCLSRKSHEITVRSSTSVSSLLSWTQSTWTEKKHVSWFSAMSHHCHVSFNSLWPGDAIRCRRSGSTLSQEMACCLTVPSHYLHQCWLIITEVLWHSPKGISWVMLNISFLDTRVSASMW